MSHAKLTISRRDFLKWAAISMGAAGAHSLLAGAPHFASAAGETLKMWWWGEQEAPGLTKFVDDTIAVFKEQTGVTIEPTLQDTTVVISEFQTASAANSAPDLQFVWNGTYHMEAAWMGYIEPLDGLLDAQMLKDASPTVMNQYDGKTYSASWYSCGPACVYNKEIFDKAGLNADEAPTTFEALLDACDKVKAKRYTPLSAGAMDQFWTEWYTGHGLSPNLDTPADALKLFSGEGLDWRDPRYYDHWAKLQQLWKAGFMNDDLMSLNLYQGIDLFGTEKVAMTWLVVPLLRDQQKKLGAEKVGLFVWPASGQGKLNNLPVKDTNAWAISSQSPNKAIAAEFIKLTQSQERMNTLWNMVGALPTTKSWDGGNVITDPWWKGVWEKWIHARGAEYVPDVMPGLFWTDANLVNANKIISGEFTPEQCGQNAYEVVQKWREQNPDMLEKYITWAASMEKVWLEKYA
jgi:raffinose/stachyose/melibiose transport system substrate-binding protein